MNNLKVISKSPLETLKIAELFASVLSKGDIVVLTGDLGAGKTKFVEGFLHKFNLQDEISSPTFNIVNEYISGNDRVYHFDLYRLEDSDEFYEIGGEEYFEDGICLIEWGELIQDALPQDYITIKICKNSSDENMRSIEFYIKDVFKYQKFKEVLDENFKY